MTSQNQASVPRHVCIIMDGNGRWAKKRLMPRNLGHRKGVETTRKAVEFFAGAGVQFLSLFAFSSENWNRPSEEVTGLMKLFMQSLKDNTGELHEKNIRIKFIGDRNLFSSDLQAQISESEALTHANQGMTLNIAANYGGRWDIVNAVQGISKQLLDGNITLDQIDTELLSKRLSLADCPDPDLFIRTGGEKRISNFLLWQLAYTEFYFCDLFWPDFTDKDMQHALDDFSRRQRRYGKTAEQVESPI